MQLQPSGQFQHAATAAPTPGTHSLGSPPTWADEYRRSYSYSPQLQPTGPVLQLQPSWADEYRRSYSYSPKGRCCSYSPGLLLRLEGSGIARTTTGCCQPRYSPLARRRVLLQAVAGSCYSTLQGPATACSYYKVTYPHLASNSRFTLRLITSLYCMA